MTPRLLATIGAGAACVLVAACSVFTRDPHFAPPGMTSLDGAEVRALIVNKFMHYPDNSHIQERFCPDGSRLIFGTRIPSASRYVIRGRALVTPSAPDFRECFYRDAEGATFIAGCDAESSLAPRRVEFSPAERACPAEN